MNIKYQKAGDSECFDVEAIEQGAYNWEHGSEIKEEQDADE